MIIVTSSNKYWEFFGYVLFQSRDFVANSLSNLQQFMQQSSGSIQPDEKGKKLTWFGFKASELITGNTLNQVQSMLKKTDL